LGRTPAEQVERDVEPTAGRHHLTGVPVDGCRVEGIDLGGMYVSRRGRRYPIVKVLNGTEMVSGEEQPGALLGEGVCNGATDRSGRAIDDGGLVLKQHERLLVCLYGGCGASAKMDEVPR
jgi:hypothetical protein